MLLALPSLVDEPAGDPGVRAVVITGSGSEYFSMGILTKRAAAHPDGRPPRFTGH